MASTSRQSLALIRLQISALPKAPVPDAVVPGAKRAWGAIVPTRRAPQGPPGPATTLLAGLPPAPSGQPDRSPSGQDDRWSPARGSHPPPNLRLGERPLDLLRLQFGRLTHVTP